MGNKVLVCFLMLFIWFNVKVSSQNNQEIIFVKKGTVRAMATLSPSKLFAKNFSPFYVHGNLEYYCEDKVSVSGEGYYYLGDLNKEQNIFQFHHQLFFGGSYHFLNNNSDLYIGLQPGISITQINNTSDRIIFNPLYSVVAGYDFFMSRFFHFFIQIRTVYGENILYVPLNLSDIRISAGLGFHITP